jgi:hypothetical protein
VQFYGRYLGSYSIINYLELGTEARGLVTGASCTSGCAWWKIRIISLAGELASRLEPPAGPGFAKRGWWFWTGLMGILLTAAAAPPPSREVSRAKNDRSKRRSLADSISNSLLPWCECENVGGGCPGSLGSLAVDCNIDSWLNKSC